MEDETAISTTVLDPAIVFGAETTSGFIPVAKLLDIQPTWNYEIDNWPNVIQVENSHGIQRLPAACDKPGTIYLIFHDDGRIDRCETVGEGKLKIFNTSAYVETVQYSDVSAAIGCKFIVPIRNRDGRVSGYSQSMGRIVRITRCLPQTASES